MSKRNEEMVKYCYAHQDWYIRDFDNINEGVNAFECLISMVEDGYMNTDKELQEHGMPYPEWQVGR